MPETLRLEHLNFKLSIFEEETNSDKDMEKYFLFGKRATDALWHDENDIDAVVDAINDLEADVFIYHTKATPIHDVLKAYSKWTDYAYLTREQYDEITSRL